MWSSKLLFQCQLATNPHYVPLVYLTDSTVSLKDFQQGFLQAVHQNPKQRKGGILQRNCMLSAQGEGEFQPLLSLKDESRFCQRGRAGGCLEQLHRKGSKC